MTRRMRNPADDAPATDATRAAPGRPAATRETEIKRPGSGGRGTRFAPAPATACASTPRRTGPKSSAGEAAAPHSVRRRLTLAPSAMRSLG